MLEAEDRVVNKITSLSYKAYVLVGRETIQGLSLVKVFNTFLLFIMHIYLYITQLSQLAKCMKHVCVYICVFILFIKLTFPSKQYIMNFLP